MKNFNKWMHRYGSFELTEQGAQAVDDFASSIGFTLQENAGILSLGLGIAVVGIIIALAL